MPVEGPRSGAPGWSNTSKNYQRCPPFACVFVWRSCTKPHYQEGTGLRPNRPGLCFAVRFLLFFSRHRRFAKGTSRVLCHGIRQKRFFFFLAAIRLCRRSISGVDPPSVPATSKPLAPGQPTPGYEPQDPGKGSFPKARRTEHPKSVRKVVNSSTQSNDRRLLALITRKRSGEPRGHFAGFQVRKGGGREMDRLDGFFVRPSRGRQMLDSCACVRRP